VIEASRSLARLMAQGLIPRWYSADQIRVGRTEDVESTFLLYNRFDAMLRKECGIKIASQASIVHISLGVFEISMSLRNFAEKEPGVIAPATRDLHSIRLDFNKTWSLDAMKEITRM
jgi:hypothetical protein